jgi:hypothetical protein
MIPRITAVQISFHIRLRDRGQAVRSRGPFLFGTVSGKQ